MTESAMTTRIMAALSAAAGALMLPACSGDSDDDAGMAEVSNETLASVVDDADGLTLVSDVLGEAGLAQVFDGAAAYTLFAPQDAAFDALGEAGDDLRSPEQRAAMVAILRDHIVPGYLTPQDIGNAIELADDGSVEMRTMGNHTLTFTSDDDAIVVTAQDGASARFSGNALRASNGVAIPLDAVLKRVPAPQS
jgi:uncharacterized surface protein with fasciclin (FAS1) repeats